MTTARFNFDLLASGEQLRSFDSVRQAKKHIANNPQLKEVHNHLFLRDNKNSHNSRWLFDKNLDKWALRPLLKARRRFKTPNP